MVWLHPIRRLKNTKRHLFRPHVDYFWITLDFIPKELPDPPIPFIQRVLGLKKPSPFSLWRLQELLQDAGKYFNFKGLIVDLRLQTLEGQFARFQSLAEIIKDFRNTYNKEIVVFSSYFTLSSYWFASIIASKGKLFLLPTGIVDTKGLKFEITYLADTLEKYGIKFEKIAVSSYKSAFDQFAKNNITPESKQNLEWLLDDWINYFAAEIQQTRNLSPENISQLINQAPWTGPEALAQQFIDKIALPEELSNLLKNNEKDKKGAIFVQFDKLESFLPIKKTQKMNQAIAIIPIVGAIIDGKSRENPTPIPLPIPLLRENQVGDLTIKQTVRRAMRDESIKAVVLYVDSPGGSVTASESIRGSLAYLASKKPLIVYMGNVAASGGYYISTAATKIVCQPGTLTGSIGVLFAKLSIANFLKNSRANTVIVSRGEHAHWDSFSHPYTDDERKSIEKIIVQTYQYFIDLVVSARHIDKDILHHQLAGGRVWTGNQAFTHHLVDSQGSLLKAINIARECAGIAMQAPAIILHHKEGFISPILPVNDLKQFINTYEFYEKWTKVNNWVILDLLLNERH